MTVDRGRSYTPEIGLIPFFLIPLFRPCGEKPVHLLEGELRLLLSSPVGKRGPDALGVLEARDVVATVAAPLADRAPAHKADLLLPRHRRHELGNVGLRLGGHRLGYSLGQIRRCLPLREELAKVEQGELVQIGVDQGRQRLGLPTIRHHQVHRDIRGWVADARFGRLGGRALHRFRGPLLACERQRRHQRVGHDRARRVPRRIANPTCQPFLPGRAAELRPNAQQVRPLGRLAFGKIGVPMAGQAALDAEQLLAPLGRRRLGHLGGNAERRHRLAGRQQVFGHRPDLDGLEPVGRRRPGRIEVFVHGEELGHAGVGAEADRVGNPGGGRGRVEPSRHVAQAGAHFAHRARAGIRRQHVHQHARRGTQPRHGATRGSPTRLGATGGLPTRALSPSLRPSATATRLKRGNQGLPEGLVLRRRDQLPSQPALLLAECRVGEEPEGRLLVVRLQPHVGPNQLARWPQPLDLVAPETAELAHQVISRQELGSGRVGEAGARLQVRHLVVALQAVALGEPPRPHGQIPVGVPEPAVLAPPPRPLRQVIRAVRSELELGRAPLAVVAGRAAEVPARVWAARTDIEVQARMRAEGARQPAPQLQRQRLAPGRLAEQEPFDVGPVSGRNAVDAEDHVAGHEPCPRGRRARHHQADGRLRRREDSARGQREPVRCAQRLRAACVSWFELRGFGGRGQRHLDDLLARVGWLRGRARHGLGDPLVARGAAVEPPDLAEVVVDLQLRKPGLLDGQRPAKGVDQRLAQEPPGETRALLAQRPFEPLPTGAMVGQGPLGRLLSTMDLGDDLREGLAVRGGALGLCLRGGDSALDLCELVPPPLELRLRGPGADVGFIARAGLVEIGAAETQLPLGVLLPERGAGDPNLQFAREALPSRLARLGRERCVRVIERSKIGRRDAPLGGIATDLLAKPIEQGPLGHGLPGGRQRPEQLLFAPDEFVASLLAQSRLGRPRLDPVAERALVSLPPPPVVGAHHPYSRG